MQDKHGPGPLADYEISLPVTCFVTGVDYCGPLMDRSAVLDQIAGRAAAQRTTTFAPAREISPELSGLLTRAVDEA